MKDEREWEARGSGTDEKSNKEWDRWSSHSWLTCSTSTEVSDKLVTRNRWKCAFVHSVSLPQTPTICYHGKLSVALLYYSAVKTSRHCKMKKKKKRFFQFSLKLSLIVITQKHRSSQQRRVLSNLTFNLDEGVVIVCVTIAIVTARVAAWKME